MMAIRESCSCGATFEASTDGLPGMRASDWRKEHKHERPTFSTEKLIAELVRRGINYTIRCAACELAGCHVGVNGGHAGLTNPPVHTKDVWLLSGLTESEFEALEE